ncbi:MAG: MYG1 family protein [Hespellia sp.]|nr:MYG1 family protein [Hespellia sp.]
MKTLIETIHETDAKGFTHGGKFHADDVFSSALLLYLNPEISIQRGNRVPDEFQGIVFDIGRGEYDHHQNDSRIRENGVAYAAFGLLWEKLGAEILGEELAQRFDHDFVEPLDINDNTGERNELAALIGDFNPSWDEEGGNDEAFFEAVRLAGNILENKFAKYRGNERADQQVEEFLGLAEDGILVMPQFVPCQKKLADTEVEFIIFPSNRGGYCIQPLKKPGSMNYKCDFPKEWLGLDGEELKRATDLKSASFCHKGGFLMTVEELDDAVEACKTSQNAYVRAAVVIYYRDKSSESRTGLAVETIQKKLSHISGMENARIKIIDFPDIPELKEDEKDEFYDIIDMEKEDWKTLHKGVLKKIMKYKPEAVIVEGEMMMAYPMMHLLGKKHIPVLVPVRSDGEVRLVRML